MSLFMHMMRFKPCWGFVIYRTDYSAECEADWTKFLEMYKEWIAEEVSSLSQDRSTDIQRWHKMTWMTDPRQFNGATFDQLREHFRCWTSNWLSELNPGYRRQPWPETYMFFVVDKEVLDNLHGQDPNPSCNTRTREKDEYPYVKAVDKNPLQEDDPYPGWMKVSLLSF